MMRESGTLTATRTPPGALAVTLAQARPCTAGTRTSASPRHNPADLLCTLPTKSRRVWEIAAPAALAAILLGTAGQASAASLASSSDASAYFYNPSGNALGGPQPMGQFVTDGGQGATVQFQPSGYLAKVTEKVKLLLDQ